MSNPTTPFSWQMPTATDLVTDLPADFAVFGQAVATSMADLLGGTTGQILAKASATDMDFVWIANDQGDITGVTAGTGITVTSPTGPVPTVAIDTAVTVDKTTAQTLTNKTLTSPALTTPTISTATTNGDILYGTGSGALARLGIGSTSQVLTVTGGIPSWATPAVSSPTFSGCLLYNSSYSTISANTVTTLTWALESFDTDSFHSTSSNTSRITIPTGKTGYYRMYGTTRMDTASTGGVQQIVFKKNNAAFSPSLSANQGYKFTRTIFQLWNSIDVYLTAADYVEMIVYNESTTVDLEPSSTYFGVQYLGA